MFLKCILKSDIPLLFYKFYQQFDNLPHYISIKNLKFQILIAGNNLMQKSVIRSKVELFFKKQKHINMVFLFVPNIIGYFRFAALFATFFTYRKQPILTVVFYGLSQVLDAFDGMAARHFNQSTRFGAVLDMVCDRASNAVFLAILAGLYPNWSWVFLGDIALDLVSHWYQMYVSLLKGAHHKESKSKYTLLNLYYSSKPVLFTLVLGNQMFLLGAYLLNFIEELGLPTVLVHGVQAIFWIGLVLFAIKKLMSIIQLISASQQLADMDIAERKEKLKAK